MGDPIIWIGLEAGFDWKSRCLIDEEELGDRGLISGG